MNFAGKVVLITGASSGIGAAAALNFAKLGASLSLTGRKLENLNEVAEKCKTTSGNLPFVVSGDVTNEQDTEKILNETIKKFGRLDVLVNNAGIIETGTIENTSLAQFDRVMNTNIRSIYHLTMLAVPHLISTKGNIVNVSSHRDAIPPAPTPVYRTFLMNPPLTAKIIPAKPPIAIAPTRGMVLAGSFK
uniref:Uncharacterized protein n=1 Tax=Megaselia scalaris TaxID=36166 RepID=T1GYV8_MEGSC